MKSTYPINNDDKRPTVSTSANFEEEPIIEIETLLPHDLTLLLKEIVKGLNLEMDPEAAIINYYPLSTTMGGHVDDAEGELTNPIISFSLGCSAIFIIGGETKENGPVYPILVRSGDCLVMSGNSRRFFHAVPCIYPGTFSLGRKIKDIQCKENVEEIRSSDIVNQIRRNIQVSEEDNSPDKAKEEKILSGESKIDKRVKIDVTVSEVMQVIDSLSIHRINFNARQVVPFGKSLKDVLDEKKEYKPYDGGRV